ncbi:MAG: ammonia-dependent NAD(+) synthetase [Campylobacteraceae bacterium]
MKNQLEIQREIAKELNVCPLFKDEKSLEDEIKKRVKFLKNALLKSGLKAFVLGISGGVDSLTTALLARRAIDELKKEFLDKEYKLILVSLPYKIQADIADVHLVMEFLNPDIKEVVNIESAVDSLSASIKSLKSANKEKKDFIVGNIKARQRMVAQYALANTYDALVLGTDHASEAVMGFFTKFGDGAFDLSPLGGLTKLQVREVARFFGADERLVSKTPTADLEDLKPLHPDELAFGVTYQEIDDFLHVKEVSKYAFETITKAYFKTMHKRALPLVP